MNEITVVETWWCILRCRSAETDTLTGELVTAGYRAWCPMFPVRFRPPNMRGHKTEWKPLLPGFVFLDADVIGKANKMRSQRRCKVFREFMFNSRHVRITDRELQPLREFAMSLNSNRKVIPSVFGPGQDAIVKEGPFKGLRARILEPGPNYSWVEIKQLKIQISTLLLSPVQA